MKKLLYNRNPLFILSHLSVNRDNEFLYGSQIAHDLSINQSSVSIILKEFQKMGLILGHNVGKSLVYNVNKTHPMVKAFRVFENIVELNGLIEDIKEHCKKIILYGSCSTGEDTVNSDIDLFVLTSEDKEFVRKKIMEYEIGSQIKAVIVDPIEFADLMEDDKVFVGEIEKGFLLWGD